MPVLQIQGAEPYMGWMAGWTVIQKIPGFYLGWSDSLGAVLGIGNIYAVIAPAALFFPNRQLFKFMSLFSMLIFIIALSMFFLEEGYAEGYFLWVVSYLGMATGFGMLSIGSQRIESTQPSN
jgi:hypothetical protein